MQDEPAEDDAPRTQEESEAPKDDAPSTGDQPASRDKYDRAREDRPNVRRLLADNFRRRWSGRRDP